MLRVFIPPTSNLFWHKIRLLTCLNEGGKTRSIAVQLILLSPSQPFLSRHAMLLAKTVVRELQNIKSHVFVARVGGVEIRLLCRKNYYTCAIHCVCFSDKTKYD